jgi:hypothetical protein
VHGVLPPGLGRPKAGGAPWWCVLTVYLVLPADARFGGGIAGVELVHGVLAVRAASGFPSRPGAARGEASKGLRRCRQIVARQLR